MGSRFVGTLLERFSVSSKRGNISGCARFLERGRCVVGCWRVSVGSTFVASVFVGVRCSPPSAASICFAAASSVCRRSAGDALA